MEFTKDELKLLYEIVVEKRIKYAQENLNIFEPQELNKRTKKLLEINNLENKILSLLEKTSS